MGSITSHLGAVFFVKYHLHTGGLELSHRLKRIHSVPDKPGDGFGKNLVNFSVQGFLDH